MSASSPEGYFKPRCYNVVFLIQKSAAGQSGGLIYKIAFNKYLYIPHIKIFVSYFKKAIFTN